MTIRKEARWTLFHTSSNPIDMRRHVELSEESQVQATAYVLPELLNYIDGAVDAPTVERGNMLRNPNDRQALQAQMSSSPERVEVALA